MTRARRLAWTAVALALLGAFLWAVGPRAVARELARADRRAFAPAPAAGLLALLAWAEAQRRLHRAAGASARAGRFARAYAVGAFWKQVLPAGRAGGPAVLAYAVGRETALEYERDLAAVSAGKYLGVAGALAPAGAGVVALGADRLLTAVAAVAGLLLVAAVALRAGARPLRRAVHAVAAAGRATVGNVSARARAALERARVERALDRAADTLGTVADDRAALSGALALTVAGWCLYAVALWTSAGAVGAAVSPALALAVVPVASVAALVPLPAGVGSEAALAGLLAAFGVALPVAAAAALLYRVATDGVVVAVGAVATLRGETPF